MCPNYCCFVLVFLFKSSCKIVLTHESISPQTYIKPPCVSPTSMHNPNRPVILKTQLDKIRSAARASAWYGPSFNPFQKIQTRSHRSNSMQLEGGLAHSQTLGELSADQQRQREMHDGINVPEYSNTFGPEFAGSDHETNKSPPEPSMASQDPINVSSVRGIDTETVGSAQARQRKGGILGRFKHRHDDDDEWEDKKSLSDKQTFTFASQLRATVLNSWINVLLIAAPVGSMSCFSCGC